MFTNAAGTIGTTHRIGSMPDFRGKPPSASTNALACKLRSCGSAATAHKWYLTAASVIEQIGMDMRPAHGLPAAPAGNNITENKQSPRRERIRCKDGDSNGALLWCSAV